MSFPGLARSHATLERAANPARPNRQRVRCQTEPYRKLAASGGGALGSAGIVVEDQLPIARRQCAEATVEAREARFQPRRIIRHRRVSGRIRSARFDGNFQRALVPGAADMFQEHELRDDIAVSPRGTFRESSLLFEPARDAVQRFVRKIIRIAATLSIEIRAEPSAHLEIAFATRIDTPVEPAEQPAERRLRWLPVFLQL